jgi:hypothetical protein
MDKSVLSDATPLSGANFQDHDPLVAGTKDTLAAWLRLNKEAASSAEATRSCLPGLDLCGVELQKSKSEMLAEEPPSGTKLGHKGCGPQGGAPTPGHPECGHQSGTKPGDKELHGISPTIITKEHSKPGPWTGPLPRPTESERLPFPMPG